MAAPGPTPKSKAGSVPNRRNKEQVTAAAREEDETELPSLFCLTDLVCHATKRFDRVDHPLAVGGRQLAAVDSHVLPGPRCLERAAARVADECARLLLVL